MSFKYLTSSSSVFGLKYNSGKHKTESTLIDSAWIACKIVFCIFASYGVFNSYLPVR